MAIGMSDGKVSRVGLYFKQGLVRGWDFLPDERGRYGRGSVIARRGDVMAVLEIHHAPLLRVSVLDSTEDVVPLPFLPAEQLGFLAASIAWAIARAREYGMFSGEG